MLDEADRMVNMEIYKILRTWPSTPSDAAFAPPGILLNVLSNLSRGHSEDRPGLDSSSTTYISRRGRGGRGLLLCFLPHVATVRGECESGWDVLTLFEHVTPGEDPRPRLVFVENDTKKCKQNVNDFIYYNDVEQHRRSWPHFALEESIYCPKKFLTLPYNCSSLSCWIKNTFTFYPLPLLPGRRLSQLELHLAMNHRIYLASVKQVLLNTCPKPDEKRLKAMWHSRPRGRRKMNLESPGRGGAGVWVD